MSVFEAIILCALISASICTAAAFGLKMLAREVASQLMLPGAMLHPPWLEFAWLIFLFKWTAIIYLAWRWGWPWLLIFVALTIFFALCSQLFKRTYAGFIHAHLNQLSATQPAVAGMLIRQMEMNGYPDLLRS